MSITRKIKVSDDHVVPTITKLDIEKALSKYLSAHWYRKIPYYQSKGFKRLKEFYNGLDKIEERVPNEKMIDLIFILVTKAYKIDTLGINKHMYHEFESLEEKFGEMWPVIKFYTQNWRFMFKGIYEDLPVLYQFPEYAVDIVCALKIILDHYYIFQTKNDLNETYLEIRKIIYNHPDQAGAFKRLIQYDLYDNKYSDIDIKPRVELLFNLIHKANYVVEIMRMLRDAKIHLSEKSALIKKNSFFLKQTTIYMLEELTKAKLFSVGFDLLIANAQYSNQIFELWCKKRYPATKMGLEQIVKEIKTKIASVELMKDARPIKDQKQNPLLQFSHFNKASQEDTPILPVHVKIINHKILISSQDDDTVELPKYAKFTRNRAQ